MSFRGRGGPRGSSRGAPPRGRGGFRGRGGGFGGYDAGPPAEVLEMGTFVHAVEGEMLCSSTNEKIPYFNAPIFLENKSPIGKVDEILGPIKEVFFTIKPQEGIQATSFKAGDKVYIGGDRLLPLDRFLPRPKPLPGQKIEKRGGRGGGRGFGRGRGAPRGAPPRGRGAPRGGFSSRGSGFSRGAPRGSAPRGRGFAPRGRARGS